MENKKDKKKILKEHFDTIKDEKVKKVIAEVLDIEMQINSHAENIRQIKKIIINIEDENK